MLDTDVIPNEKKLIPVRVLKAMDFLALTLNTIFVTMVTLIAIVVCSLFFGIPDFSISRVPSTFGIVSSIGLAALLVVDLLIPYVIALNVVSFSLKMTNDTSQSWKFLITKPMRYLSLTISFILIAITITVLVNIGLS